MIIHLIRKELKSKSSPEVVLSTKRFFKENIKVYGVRLPVARSIGKRQLKSIMSTSSKDEILDLCTLLWRSGFLEESIIACDWSYSCRKQFIPDDFDRFEVWVVKYVHNWSSCDTLCNHTIGEFIEMYPAFLENLKKWAFSNNRWVRRASAVSLIIPAKKREFLKDIFEIANILLLDKDDLVQKGYGWMLKAASQNHQDEIFEYVMDKKAVMPRTAFRYAIEKLSGEMRREAMK